MSARKLLVVDDKKNIRRVLRDILLAVGYEVVTAASGEDAVTVFATELPDLILTDLKMDGMSGIDLIRTIRKKDKFVPIILLTAYGSISSAVDAMKAGANDYLTKPLDYDLLRLKVEKTLAETRCRAENQELKANLQAQWGMDNLIGRSAAMRRVYSLIRTVGPTETNVLIQGECGTGKELIARSLYVNSPRADQPYIVVDCSAMPEGLMESELFGYEKGAFTGAATQKKGRIEQAEGGTLFLDEIGELPLACQAKLLRVIQERQFMRVGGSKPVDVDFRLIAATNKNLAEEVAEKRFRADLYYRLNVISIESPPLRDRGEDIPLLVDAFWESACAHNHLPPSRIDPRHMARLMAYSWPGNVRELKNCVERLVLIDSLPPEIESVEDTLPHQDQGTTLSDIERDVVEEALIQNDWNISHAARALGIGRKALYNRIKKYELTVP